MPISRRELLKAAACAASLGPVSELVHAQVTNPLLETQSVTLAVHGGQPVLARLPLVVAQHEGYFEDAGLAVKVVEAAPPTGEAPWVPPANVDVVCGPFEHAVRLQGQGHFYRCFVLQNRAPMVAVIATAQAGDTLRGRTVGVPAADSLSRLVLGTALHAQGESPGAITRVVLDDDQAAIEAWRAGKIDALVARDPLVGHLAAAGDVRVLADTRTVSGAQALFKGNAPSDCLYAEQTFVDANPNAVQALTTAIVRAEQWLQGKRPDAVAELLQDAGAAQGDMAIDPHAVERNREALSPDGLMPSDGPQTVLNALDALLPHFNRVDVDISRTWTNEFVTKATQAQIAA